MEEARQEAMLLTGWLIGSGGAPMRSEGSSSWPKADVRRPGQQAQEDKPLATARREAAAVSIDEAFWFGAESSLRPSAPKKQVVTWKEGSPARCR